MEELTFENHLIDTFCEMKMLKLKRHQGKMVDRVRQLEAEANTARKVLLTTPHGPPPHSAETGGYCRFLSFDPPPSTPHPQTSTLNSQLSTLNPQPSTLNPQPSTLNPQPSTLNPQPSTLNPES